MDVGIFLLTMAAVGCVIMQRKKKTDKAMQEIER